MVKSGNINEADIKKFEKNLDAMVASYVKDGLKLDKDYGIGTAQDLEFLSKSTVKITRVEYNENITYYKTLVKNLKKEKGLE